MAIMDPLTIGAAIPGLLTSAIKLIRLLKSFTLSPDSPKSMKVVLGLLISISTSLKDLRQSFDEHSNIPNNNLDLINIQCLIVPLTSCIITFSHLEHLIDIIRADPKCPARLCARLEGISSLDYVNSTLSDEDVIRIAETSETRTESRRFGHGVEKEVVGLAVLDDGLSWMILADYDERAMADSGNDEKLPLFRKQKWNENHLEDMLKILRNCQEMLGLLTSLFRGSIEQLDISIQRLSELASQILEDKPFPNAHDVEKFATHNTSSNSKDSLRANSTSEHLAKQRFQLAFQLYLHGEISTLSSPNSPSPIPTTLDSIANQPLPLLPSAITNTAWYRFPLPLPPVDPDSEQFTITVKTLAGKLVLFNISTTTTCRELKQLIERTEGPRLDQQYLVCEPDHRWLPEDMVLSESGIGEGSKIHFLLPFWGRGRM
ncbi:hypothetical protein ONS96_008630 [Cadophora gregata f. sp. sojae]|nr:hypothetical protein ONS96_008630 [Cadophora gregata f. sp. sojae]